VVGVIEKQNFAIEVHMYDVPVHNVGVVEVEGATVDLKTLVEVGVGQVESGTLVGQKFKKSTEDIRVSLGSHDGIFAYVSSLEDIHELDNLLQKNNSFAS